MEGFAFETYALQRAKKMMMMKNRDCVGHWLVTYTLVNVAHHANKVDNRPH